MKKRILIVEDTPQLLEDMEHLIDLRFNCQTCVATNERDAIREIGQRPFSIIITDIDLTKGGGQEDGGFLVAEALLEQFGNQPIIIITSFCNTEHVERVKRFEAAVFLARSGEYLGKLESTIRSFLAGPKRSPPTTEMIRLLHLSDLHFNEKTQVDARLEWLIADLRRGHCLEVDALDFVVISGDFTDRGSDDGFDKAHQFILGLTEEFGIPPERCIFVPGNHDVVDVHDAYVHRKKVKDVPDDHWFQEGPLNMVRNPDRYNLRLKQFSDRLFRKFHARDYPLDEASQGEVVAFWDTGLQFVALNSCWQVDEFYRKRSGLHPDAVAKALREARRQESEARHRGEIRIGPLRIAVWHHAVAGHEGMRNTDVLENIKAAGVKLVLHGDVHDVRRDQDKPWENSTLYAVGAGAFGAPWEQRPESTARLYNLVEIRRDLSCVRVHTRRQDKPDGAWKGLYQWPDPSNSKGMVPYYDLDILT